MEQKDTKKPKWVIILVISLILLVIALGLIYFLFLRAPATPQSAASTSAETMTQQPSTVQTEKETETETQKPAETVKKVSYELAEEPDIDAIDFKELQSINEEIYAWIYVPDTGIDYPVAQAYLSGDDSYYLEHNIYREYQFSGTIYSECQNTRSFDDPVTVLYGHNMINGSMFQQLHNFEDRDFFDKHTTMFVFTPDKLITYLIYSCFDYDDRHILNSFHLDKSDEFMDFVSDTLDPHSSVYNVREGVEIKEDDKLLVLSTCSNHSYSSRYLTVGVKVRERSR